MKSSGFCLIIKNKAFIVKVNFMGQLDGVMECPDIYLVKHFGCTCEVRVFLDCLLVEWIKHIALTNSQPSPRVLKT